MGADVERDLRATIYGWLAFTFEMCRQRLLDPSLDADLIADNWRKLIDQPHTGSLPPKQDDDGPILACCLACLLSARTHEAESPGKLAEAHRGR